MSGEPKTLTLTERESYLISRVGGAWVELNRKHYDFARDELAEAQMAADDVTEAAARARGEAAELREAALRYLATRRAYDNNEYDDGLHTDGYANATALEEQLRYRQETLRRLAGGEERE